MAAAFASRPATTFGLIGIALLVLGSPDVAGARLASLADARWRAEGGQAAAPGRWVVRAADTGGLIGVSVLASAVGWLASGALAAGCLLAVALAASWCVRFARRERDAERARLELAAAVGALRDEYSAGATVAAAFRSAAEVAGQHRRRFAAAADSAIRGDSLARSLMGRDPSSHTGSATGSSVRPSRDDSVRVGLAGLALGCQVASGSGASLTATLAGVQADIAADRAVHRTVAAALAAPRASAFLLAGLPLVGLGLGAAMGADPLRVLLHTGYGAALLLGGLALDLAGLAWTLTLTRRAAP
jgi:tight adherence protein B